MHKIRHARSGKLHSPDSRTLEKLFHESAGRHHHLCPRQVLGVRLGLCGLRQLGLLDEKFGPRFDNRDKRLLAIVETDGCGADGISVAVDCTIGRRTLRVLDFGKLAATLVDTHTGRSVRVAPATTARELAIACAPGAPSRWHAYLQAYQTIADEELIRVQDVQLVRSIAEIVSKPDARAVCDVCLEEVINDRDLKRDGLTLCRSCAGDRYYRDTSP